MRRVRFTRTYVPYMVGELAGFNEDVAAKIVGTGAAAYVIDEPVAVAEEPAVVAAVVEAPPVQAAMPSPRGRGRPRVVR